MDEDEITTPADGAEESEAEPDTASELAEFFGVELDDESDETPGETDETPGETDETPGTTDETPGTTDETPGETDEAPGTTEETPGTTDVQYDDQGRVLNEQGVPLNEYGMPDITKEEWDEFLADDSIPMSERLTDWQTYHNELQRRQNIRTEKLVEMRAEEVTQTRAYVGKLFEQGEEAYAELEVGAKKILDFVPAEMRNTPGYHEWAVKLAAVDLLPSLIEKYGLKAVQDAAGQAPTTPTGKSRVRLAGSGHGNTPAPAPRPAASTSKATPTLSADEIAFAKSVGMTAEEYAANK